VARVAEVAHAPLRQFDSTQFHLSFHSLIINPVLRLFIRLYPTLIDSSISPVIYLPSSINDVHSFGSVF
jgi:hypothetical protein